MTGQDTQNANDAIAAHGPMQGAAYDLACIKLDALSAAWVALATEYGGDDNVPETVRRAMINARRAVWAARTVGGAK